MIEEWLPIANWPNYKISNYGEVYNEKRRRLLKKQIDRGGYFRVTLGRGTFYSSFSVHRLVALTFVDGWFEEAEVNHKDGIKLNNRSDNLEWVTHVENMRHAVESGLMRPRGPQIWPKTIYIEEG